jgi:hypothetical protein
MLSGFGNRDSVPIARLLAFNSSNHNSFIAGILIEIHEIATIPVVLKHGSQSSISEASAFNCQHPHKHPLSVIFLFRLDSSRTIVTPTTLRTPVAN